jgi:hypothetical protein
MTKDNFIKQQDIVYLDHKDKKRNWHLHKNQAISLHIWTFNHLDDVFYFKMWMKLMGFMSHLQ